MADTFRVLFVCTGNVCRSPMAQTMLTYRLRAALDERAEVFEVTSAGTGALTGEPMEAFAIDALADLGIPAEEFTARDATTDLLEAADLILTATRLHRSAVVTAQPSVVRRLFTIKEFARLARMVTPEESVHDCNIATRARRVVERVVSQRGMHPPVPPNEDDVDDPYGQSPRRFSEAAAAMQPAIDVLAALLVGAATDGDGDGGSASL